MKNKHPIVFSLLALFMLVAGLVVPASLASPAPAQAAPGMLKWSTVDTPGSFGDRADIVLRSEIDRLVVGPRGTTLLAVVTRTTMPAMQLYSSGSSGRSWGGTSGLRDAMLEEWGVFTNVWDAAIAPDDQKFWAVATSSPTIDGPVEVWVTQDGGTTWENTKLGLITADFISCIDISMRYAGKRDILVGTRDGSGLGTAKLWVRNSTPFSTWRDQTDLTSDWANPGGDVVAAKFSPTYASDGSIVAVYSAAPTGTPPGTLLTYGIHDLDANATAWGTPIEVKDPASAPGASPDAATIVTADLELPSDFSGQAASLRRAYVSFYSSPKDATNNQNGIYRIDDNVVYVLMDTTNVTRKDISSIAYYGTYASGKLLAGEVYGYPCTATVPTWFTDSPTVCPIPCWYPALKPTTGAAGITCALGWGYGNAQVGWSPDGTLAFVGTGSACLGPFDTPDSSINCATPEWPDGYLNWAGRDESAFGISRNNGETWNQLGLIDTLLGDIDILEPTAISQFTDVAPTPDCKTIYLASVSKGNQAGCDEFDSVWRSSSNPAVESPLSAMPVGSYWERIFTHVTAVTCTEEQTDVALLRIVPYCADPNGQMVAWAAQGTKAQAWSPDYGDYWAMIQPRDNIQDFTFESKTVMYNLSPNGLVQKLPYTGTAWATTLPSVDSIIYGAHTIAAYPEGKVLVGAAAEYHQSLYAASYSGNFNTDNPSFSLMSLAGRTEFAGDVHVAFHPNFKDNNTIFIADSGATGGSVYRNNPAAQLRWDDTNMMAAINGAVGCNARHQVPQSGLVLSFTGEALYSSHAIAQDFDNSGVCRTISSKGAADVAGAYGPLSGMPKPGIAWDCLNTFTPTNTAGVTFTREPSSLKACGCCTTATDTTLYALDARNYVPADKQGMLWAFTDCLAKRGPKLITPDKTLIGCDPVSGRAQEVNFCWEQLCLADAYDLEISKVNDFSILVIDVTTEDGCGGLEPADVTTPCVYFPAGGRASGGSALALWGNLECGHTYYWRIKARHGATGQDIRSPWSDVRSFTVKAGLPVSTPYYGIQLLSPNNGGLGIPVKPVSFSWSPFKGTTKYKFVLAKDAAMTQIVKEAETTTTAFEYDGTLDYNSNYFWRVMAVTPAPSDWSAAFSFLTEASPSPPAPEAPSKAGFWDTLAMPAKAVLNWIATINFQLTPVGPMPLWFPVSIIVSIVLFILWLLVMLAISKLIGKPFGKIRRS